MAELYQNYRRQKQSKYSGFLIHEFQQNSDTTYRVFDWNRLGLDGKPRQLHVEQSMASIDFGDFEPAMDVPADDNLATCEYFKTDRKSLVSGEMIGNPDPARFSILSVAEGFLTGTDGRGYGKGQFILLPRNAAPLQATCDSTILQVTLP